MFYLRGPGEIHSVLDDNEGENIRMKEIGEKMKKRWKKAIAIVLAAAILVNSFPVMAAENVSVEEQPEIAVPEAAGETAELLTEEPYIVAEMTEKRESDTKYFLMSDRSIKACVYPQPVHFLHEGSYEDIDNRLEYKIDTNKNGYYENKANSFKVKLPQIYEREYTEFSDQNGYVKFRLIDAENEKNSYAKEDVAVNETETRLEIQKKAVIANKDETQLDHINNRVKYEAVHKNVDIQYDITGDRLKETIVLNEFMDHSYTFELLTSAEAVRKNNDGSVSFFDAEGKEVYLIEAPYMQDAKGEYTNHVAVELSGTDGGYLLTYTPDYDWLADSERQYPVLLDPTLVQWVSGSDVTDTYISNVQTASVPDIRGTWDILNIGKRPTLVDGGQLTMRGMVRFELPSQIEPTDCIIDARLNLIHYTDSRYVSNNGIQIDVHELTGSFSEGGTWWGNAPSYNPVIEDYAFVNTANKIGDTDFSYDSYNVTRLVNKWHTGGTNYGILLKLHDDAATVSARQQVYYFAKQSVYYGSISKYVEITYRNTVGIEDYWSYTSQDASRHGVGYVNNYNGNLVFVHNDAAFSSAINDFTVAHIYNSATAANGDTRYGSGWKLNLVQSLKEVSDSNINAKYVYTDGDGTKHYFVESNGKIVDEDGLGYTLTNINESIDNGASSLTLKIESKDKTVLKFDSLGALRRIADTNNNTIILNYSGSTADNHYLTSVTTSSGGEISLVYSGNRLEKIVDNAGRVTLYTYSGNNLSKITYPDNITVTFAYSGSLLTDVAGSDNIKLKYAYNANKRIVRASVYSTDGIEGYYNTFAYNHNQTVVGAPHDRSYTYQFDNLGRATCIYDNEQNIYSQTYTKTTFGNKIFQNNKIALSSRGSTYVNNLLNNATFVYSLNQWSQNKGTAQSEISVAGSGLLTSKSIKISNPEAATTTISQSPAISAGSTYTVSGYIKTENVASVDLGAGIQVVTSQNKVYYSELLTGTSESGVENGYQLVSVTFTLAAGENLQGIYVGLFHATGIVYVDSVQLEQGNSANPINLVYNSGFENNGGENSLSGEYYSSFAVGADKGGCTSSTAHEGSYSARIVGSATEGRYISQKIEIGGKKGDVYSFGGWARADAVPNHSASSDEYDFRFAAYIKYTDGTDEWFKIDLNEHVNTWQYAMQVFIAKKDYEKLGIYCSYNKNCNTAYFDSLFLYKDFAQSYSYDDKGNVISTTDLTSQQGTFEYKNDNLVNMISPKGSSYFYSYDSKNNLTYAKDENMQYSIQYDSHGNPIKTTTAALNPERYLQSEKDYVIVNQYDGKALTVSTGDSQLPVKTSVFEENSTSYLWNIRKLYETKRIAFTCVYFGDTLRLIQDYMATKEIGKNLRMINCGGYGPHETFIPMYHEDGSYSFVFAYSNTVNEDSICLSASDSSHVQIQKYDANDKKQRWYFYDAKSYLSVNADTTGSSNKLLSEYEPAGSLESGEGYYLINAGSGRAAYLETTSALYKPIRTGLSTANLAHAVWFLDKDSDSGSYSIRNIDKFTDDTGEHDIYIDTYLLQKNIQADKYKEQKYDIELADNGFYKIYSCQAGRSILLSELNNENYRDKIKAKSASDPESIYDYWYFVPVSSVEQPRMMTSSAAYSADGNYQTSSTDSRGNTTSYSYDTARGLTTAVTNSAGTVTDYTYNPSNDLLESVGIGGKTVDYEYNTNGSLKNILSPSGTEYSFNYDNFGRTAGIYVGDRLLSSMSYRDKYSSLLSRLDYGNGNYRTYSYDTQDRLIGEYANGNQITSYVYNKSGQLSQKQDLLAGTLARFRYDLSGRTLGMSVSKNGSEYMSLANVYDNGIDRLIGQYVELPGIKDLNYAYKYGKTAPDENFGEAIYGVSLNGTTNLSYGYDHLGRLSERKLDVTSNGFTTHYFYEEIGENGTSPLVTELKSGEDTYEYAYDSVGNITSISKNGTVVESYTYDGLSQLKTVTRGNDVWEYTYDNGGNILSVTKNGVTEKTYTYGDSEWKDLLTQFNGQTITYDQIGNPLQYRDGMALTWQNGRRLSTISKGSDSISYSYDADGLRTSKTVNGTTTNYYWLNGTLQAQKTGDEYILFLYDESGSAYGMIVKNGSAEEYYYYVYNLQGDVIGIIDESGNTVIEYSYNAWGEIETVTGTLAETVGQRNPIRYRGYYYDGETGFYYAGSRYYDPEVGRWISADGAIAGVGGDIRGYNLFAYCMNNPVNMSDSTGHWPKWIKNSVKWVSEKVFMPMVKKGQKIMLKKGATYSMGVCISGTPSIFSFNLQGGISVDREGSVAVQGTFSGGVTTGTPCISATLYKAVSNAPIIDNLNGPGYQVGGSIGVPVYGVPLAAGADFNIIPDEHQGETYYGLTTGIGIGTPGAEFHVEWGETATWGRSKYNIFETIDNIYIKIMGW